MPDERQREHMEQLFLSAYDDFADAIFRHCALRIGDREVGRDLMQDTFVKAWQYAAKGEKVENMRAFLYRVANNLIIDHVRRAKRRRVESIEALQETGWDLRDDSAEAHTDRRFSANQVMDALQHIDEPYRQAVVLRFVDGYQPREIADLLGVSANVASVRVNRGIQKLKTLLHADE
jgi:RNA polymerase sigma-70 factor (ECF subfamily)